MNVNFAVTKMLALAPHGADKQRLEGDTHLSLQTNFTKTIKTTIYLKLGSVLKASRTVQCTYKTYNVISHFQMISDSSLLKLKAG